MSAVAGVALFAPRAATTGRFEFALSYLLVRVALVALYARAFRHVVEARHPLAIYLAGFSLSAVLWSASLAATDEARPAIWAAAVVVELPTPLLGWRGFGEHAFDLGHLSERFGQFMLIVLGEAALGIVAALSNVRFHPAVVVSAAAAGVIVFCLWWHNFDFLQRRVPHGSWTVLYVHGATPVFIAVAAFGMTLDVAIQDTARPPAALVRWIASGALATYLVVPTAIQLGGTALELDPATVSRLVAAAALLGLAAAGGAIASDVFLLLITDRSRRSHPTRPRGDAHRRGDTEGRRRRAMRRPEESERSQSTIARTRAGCSPRRERSNA
jgi:low temperature requirement protein LtrA